MGLEERIRECPHCLGRVMVMSDGKCPTCWGDTNQPPEVDSLIRVTIHADKPTRKCCVNCGTATKNSVKITEWDEAGSNEQPQSSPLEFLLGFIPFGGLLQRLFGSGSDRARLSLKISQCKECCITNHDNVRVLAASHSMRTITIGAHPAFADKLGNH